LREEYRSLSSSLCSFLHSPVISSGHNNSDDDDDDNNNNNNNYYYYYYTWIYCGAHNETVQRGRIAKLIILRNYNFGYRYRYRYLILVMYSYLLYLVVGSGTWCQVCELQLGFHPVAVVGKTVHK
jgi:hypothetical protein